MTLRPDATWITTDPLGRRVVSLEGIERRRALANKHSGPDSLTVVEAKEVIERPDTITQSASNSTRYVYYRRSEQEKVPPYKRATVSFTEGESEDYDGVLISWSRYRAPVDGTVIWKEDIDENV